MFDFDSETAEAFLQRVDQLRARLSLPSRSHVLMRAIEDLWRTTAV